MVLIGQVREADVGTKPFQLLKFYSCVDLAHGVETGHKSQCSAKTIPLLLKISINNFVENVYDIFIRYDEIKNNPVETIGGIFIICASELDCVRSNKGLVCIVECVLQTMHFPKRM